jgi:hypothetical protein
LPTMQSSDIFLFDRKINKLFKLYCYAVISYLKKYKIHSSGTREMVV